MDIRAEIYKEIADRKGIGYPEDELVAKRLSEADTQKLVQDMDQFYESWFEIQQLQDENFDEARADLEYIQESSFEIVCQALALKSDPSVLPYFLKYVPVDGRKRAHHQVVMEDYNEQNLERCIVNPDYYGEAYIPVLLAHIHELVPEKMRKAQVFYYQMVLDDLAYFRETHPFFNNLNLAQKDAFTTLINYSIHDTLDYIRRNEADRFEFLKDAITQPIPSITFEDEPLIQIAYVRQEFLKLHAAD